MKTFRWFAAAMVASAPLLVACGGGDGDGGGDLAATCELMETIEGPEDITVQKLDDLLEVAPDAVEGDIRLIRDRVEEEGEAAYEDEEVGAAFERVGAFEAEEC